MSLCDFIQQKSTKKWHYSTMETQRSAIYIFSLRKLQCTHFAGYLALLKSLQHIFRHVIFFSQEIQVFKGLTSPVRVSQSSHRYATLWHSLSGLGHNGLYYQRVLSMGGKCTDKTMKLLCSDNLTELQSAFLRPCRSRLNSVNDSSYKSKVIKDFFWKLYMKTPNMYTTSQRDKVNWPLHTR